MKFADGEKPSFLKLDSMSADETKLVMTLNGEKTGATFRLRQNNGLKIFDGSNILIKPLDTVKISFHTGTPGPNQEHFTWWKYHVEKAETDLNIDVIPIDGLTLTAGVKAEDYWIKDAETPRSDALKAAYNIDGVGTVYGYYGFLGASDNVITAGYNGAFGPVSLFGDVSFELKEKTAAVKADVDVTFTRDTLSAEVYTLFMCEGMDTTSTNSLALLAKVGYDLGACKAYVNFEDENLMASTFAATVKAGTTFNCGSAGIDAALQFDIRNETTVSVPVSVSLGL